MPTRGIMTVCVLTLGNMIINITYYKHRSNIIKKTPPPPEGTDSLSCVTHIPKCCNYKTREIIE